MACPYREDFNLARMDTVPDEFDNTVMRLVVVHGDMVGFGVDDDNGGDWWL